jgi:hypothetical protein
MVLTPGRSVAEAVADILVQDFHGDFEEVFQAVFDLIGEVPSQANNGVRNMANHMALALSAKDLNQADLELERCLKHLYFAKYDCLLLAVVDQLKLLTKYVDATKDKYPGDFADLCGRLIGIKQDYQAIPRQSFLRRGAIAEVIADTNAVKSAAERVERVLVMCNRLRNYLYGTYPLPPALLEGKKQSWLNDWLARHPGTAALLWAVLGALIGGFLFSCFLLEDWATGLRNFFGRQFH